MINNKYPTTKPSLNLDFANTKSLDPRINFRRGTPGTYYDGVTHAKAEENLLSYSEDFSQWEQNQNTIDSTLYDAPDGSQTASKIIANSTSANHWMLRDENISSGKTYTMSIYAKAAGYNYLTIFESTRFMDDFTGWVTFNLTGDGSIAYATDIVSHSITNVGNDWYRCSVTAIATSDGSGRFGIKPRPDTQGGANPAFTGDDSSGMLFWGAQLEQRDSVTSYTATNGAPITKYQPKLMTASPDDARFDHDPITGESKGLLIEEQRTNLIAYSEDFGNAAWIKQNGHPYESNVAVGLDGSVSATRIYKTSDQWIRYQYTQAGTYTLSCWVKSEATSGDFTMESYNPTDNSANGSDSFTATNKWKRFSRTVTIDTADGTTSWYPCVPANTNEKFYIWGAQLEAGSFVTSYIKTTGASATRSADNASITGENFSSWYRQDEGSFEIDASLLSSSTTQTGRFITISDGSTGNKIQIDNNNTTLNFYIGTRSAQQGLYTWDRDTVLDYKFAFGLKKDDVAFCKNNESVAIDSSVELFAANRLDIKHENNFLEQLNGYIKKLAYYPQRLTNEQLQNLTK